MHVLVTSESGRIPLALEGACRNVLYWRWKLSAIRRSAPVRVGVSKIAESH